MDPVAQLHTAQQEVFEALDLGSWTDVGRATGRLIELEQRCIHPAARRCGVGPSELGPGLDRHSMWIGLMRAADHAAWREQLRNSLIDHVAWTGSELVSIICLRLDRPAYDELGVQIEALTLRRSMGEVA